MDIFPSFLPVLGHGVFHAIDSQYVSRLQTRHTSPEVGMQIQMQSVSVLVVMIYFLNMFDFSTIYIVYSSIYIKYYLQRHACPYELFHDTHMMFHVEV